MVVFVISAKKLLKILLNTLTRSHLSFKNFSKWEFDFIKTVSNLVKTNYSFRVGVTSNKTKFEHQPFLDNFINAIVEASCSILCKFATFQ